jgi:hypothetical protein
MFGKWAKDLNSIAQEQKLEKASNKNWYNELREDGLGQQLYQLALQVRGVQSLETGEVLPTFCTNEAQQLLMSMPNYYWFWHVLQDAIFREGDESDRIGIQAVQRAVHELRCSATYAVDLKRRVEDLSATEACMWMALGIVLVKTEGHNTTVLVRNPIYRAPAMV